jgi:hypothetical protein
VRSDLLVCASEVSTSSTRARRLRHDNAAQ